MTKASSAICRTHDGAPRSRERLILGLVTGLIVAPLLVTVTAEARPGGGGSYSGRSSSGGVSRGGGGGGGLRLGGGGGSSIDCAGIPDGAGLLIGGAIVVLVIVGFYFFSSSPDASDSWETASSTTDYDPRSFERFRQRPDLAPLRQYDPAFSALLLEDFLQGLYVRAHEARGPGGAGLATLAPYLAPEVRGALGARAAAAARAPAQVTGVVVGAQRLLSVRGLEAQSVSGRVEIEVAFESNYTERFPDGREMGYFAEERWTLSRRRDAKSRPPDRIHALHCPSCGAPVEGSQDEACTYCGASYGAGELDWFVTRVTLVTEEPRGPLLTGTVEEKGTNLPTVIQPGLAGALGALKAKDPAFAEDAFGARLKLVFAELQQHWTNLTWEAIRPLVTDRFHLSQQYWINAYRTRGLRNRLDGARLTRWEIAKVDQDPWFDAITVRVYGAGLDYTVEVASDRVVAGSKTTERTYSEYWTFIRSATAQGPARADKQCPNCGGPLTVNMAGSCESCGGKVTGGAFDWVLSRIEQDEAYLG